MTPHNEVRPSRETGAQESTSAANLRCASSIRLAPVVVDGEPARVVLHGPPLDLATLNRRDASLYMAARHDGWLEGEVVGYRRGWEACDEAAQRLHDTAVRVVRAMERVDPYADRQRRATGGGR